MKDFTIHELNLIKRTLTIEVRKLEKELNEAIIPDHQERVTEYINEHETIIRKINEILS